MQIFSEKVNRLLGEMEDKSGIYWNIPKEVAQYLYYLVISGKFKKVLEIGTSNGYSGLWLAQALSLNDGRLVTIESHAERFALAQKTFLEADLVEYILQVKGHAPEVFTEVTLISEGGFDLIFMDATKKQHLEFLKESFGLLKIGGLIVVDNVLSHWKEMESLVEYVEKCQSLIGEVVKVGDGLLICYKNGESL